MFDEEKADEQETEPEKPTDWSGAIIGILLLPVFFFFMHEGKEDVGLNVCVCLLGLLLAVKACWELRMRIWFWGIILLVLAADVPLMLMIRWPQSWVPGLALLPIALAEFLVTVWASDLFRESSRRTLLQTEMNELTARGWLYCPN